MKREERRVIVDFRQGRKSSFSFLFSLLSLLSDFARQNQNDGGVDTHSTLAFDLPGFDI